MYEHDLRNDNCSQVSAASLPFPPPRIIIHDLLVSVYARVCQQIDARSINITFRCRQILNNLYVYIFRAPPNPIRTKTRVAAMGAHAYSMRVDR